MLLAFLLFKVVVNGAGFQVQVEEEEKTEQENCCYSSANVFNKIDTFQKNFLIVFSWPLVKDKLGNTVFNFHCPNYIFPGFCLRQLNRAEMKCLSFGVVFQIVK